MFKRISVQHLTTGMYIYEMCGPWISHPFWRSAFLLTDASDLQRLRKSKVTEVWIDPARGKDIAPGVPCVVWDPQQTSDPDRTPPTAKPQARPLAAIDTAPTSLGKELHTAMALCEQSRDAMLDMFSEARMGRAIGMDMAENLVNEITGSVLRSPDALLSVARLKTADNYTYMHSVAVSGLMVALARKLGHDEAAVRRAGMAGLLHDLGKAHMDPAILNKPGRLTDAEFAHIKGHPRAAYDLLCGSSDMDATVLDACLHHHERLDGGGYPDGLGGDEISLLARMTAICDVYDAITSDRPYKKGWPPSESLRRMAEWTGSHLDKRLFETFVKTVGIYPVGSLVRLQSERLAVVSEPSVKSLTAPRVVVFYCTQSQRNLSPQLVDLSQPGQDRIVCQEDPSEWPFTHLETLWRKGAAATA
ncbi:HD-GYP domain-containing protein [Comamonas terrigena]|jgi:putative nucleotidyltransferase with HDIG domain|uniref:HD-GYP domain-containing protein n=1 Tax=Comamonas terrigena TaxID=32013 RepID=UPI00244AEB0E|nr:HD-GYP domain-containing protein [Comamonas terrigena]MDH0049849.1 HD-GYP domain-containing protein [Comamonas terrigena]MDH0511202.1 HD-GYP domain-containing protein [Comamonas terrigena]MDH1090804.1 HD-GYP domain-containing protein [Comamonas terrigena]